MSQDILFALLGGAIIGLSASLMLRLNGEVAGISGIFESSVFGFLKSENTWKVFFVVGLLSCGYVLSIFRPSLLENTFDQVPYLTILGGFLVGFGTRLGSGCTSGHGVCGVSRFSIRSIIATITFMAAGFLSVYLTLHFFKIGAQL